MRALGLPFAATVFLLSGCMGGGSGESSWGSADDRWHIRYTDSSDSVELLGVTSGSHSWSEWTTKEVTATMRVGLNTEPGATGGVAVGKGTTSLGGLGSSPVKVGDKLEFCATESATEYTFTLSASGGGGGIHFDSLKAC